MKYRKAAFALALLGLAACGSAQSDARLAPVIGEIYGGKVTEFKTPGGAYCVYVSGYKEGGLSCKFP